MRAMKPPSGVIPTRSPMPRTETSTWVAPAATRLVGVGHGAAGVVVAVEADVALHGAPDLAEEREDLARGGDAHGVGQPDAVDAELLGGPVDRQEVGLLGAEGVLGARSGPPARPSSASSMGGPMASMICWMLLPWEASRRMRLVAKRRPMPRTPVSSAAWTSSTTQRAWVMTRAPRPSLTMRGRRRAATGARRPGEVSSM